MLQEVNPPSVKLEGLFFLACVVAGIAGGGIAIFFWKGARYFVGCWGGFALALYIQCMHDGGVIKPLGFRWLFYIAVAAVGFIASTFPRLHYPVLLVSTAFVGSTAVILGVDCLSTAGLKEFYVSNLGFGALFVPFTSHGMPYPVSQTMMIELGLIAAVALMGVAVQLRFYQILKRKMREIEEQERKREMERDEKAAERFRTAKTELDDWEKEHGEAATLGGGTPGAKDIEAGVLPNLDLGSSADAEELSGGIVKSDSEGSVAEPRPSTQRSIFARRAREDPELKEKLAMLEEIRKVRQNIDSLRRSTSISEHTAVSPTSDAMITPDRPQRADRPRSRVIESMDVSRLSRTLKLPDDPEKMVWDEYAKDRKLFTPPAGYTPPIPTSPVPMSPAVQEALDRRTDLERHLALSSSGDEGGSGPRGRRASKSSGLLTLDLDKTERRSTSRFSGLFPAEGERRLSEDVSRRERKVSAGRLSAPEGGDRRSSIGSVLDQLQHSPTPPPVVEEEEDLASTSPDATTSPEAVSPSKVVFNEPADQIRATRHTSMMSSMPFPGAQQRVAALFTPKNRHTRSTSMVESTTSAAVTPTRRPTNNEKPGMSSRRNLSVTVPPAAAAIPRRRPVSPPPQASPFTVPQTPGELAAISTRHREKMRAMQAPLTREEQERRKLEDAKDRWERSKAVERQVMERKDRELRQSRVLEEDELLDTADGGKSRRPAADKVLQWQKRSSTMMNLDAERKQQQRRSTARVSGADFFDQPPVLGGLRSASPVDAGYSSTRDKRQSGVPAPPQLAPPINKRSSTSRSLNAWNMFSSPGAQRPPSPDLPAPTGAISPN